MLFPSVGGYKLANYKMLIPSEGGYMLRKNVISKRRRLYVEEHRSYNLFHIIFPICFILFSHRFYDPFMAAILYSRPILIKLAAI